MPERRRDRARPMSPDERRDAIVTAARPLLVEHGPNTTTKLIAEAAGIAEGTVFRAFATKEELVEAVLTREFDHRPFLAALEGIDPEQPLRDRLVAATDALRRHFTSVNTLLSALGLPKPPREVAAGGWERRRQSEQAIVDLIGDDADRFRIPVTQVVLMLRLLTFSGSHPHLNTDEPLTAEEIVDVILHGTLATGEHD